jgi:hypothetical protein
MIRDLMRLTLRDPRGGMRAVLNLGLDDRMRWLALVLVAVVTTVVSGLAVLLAGMQLPEVPRDISPLPIAAIQVVVMAVGAVLVHILGRAAGGQGRFTDAILVVVWLQVFLVVLQVAQVAAAVLIPPLAPIVFLVTVVAIYWFLTHFVAELHGFKNLFAVFGAILGATVLLSILLSPILLPLMGVEVPNV